MPLIAFASPAGGVGRTTLVANIAAEMATAGERVIALDLDPKNCLGLQFGMALDETTGLVSTLRDDADRHDWKSLLRPINRGGEAADVGQQASYVPHGRLRLADAVELDRRIATEPALLSTLLQDMLSADEVILIADLPAGPSAALAAILPLVTLIIVVLRPDALSVSQLGIIERELFSNNRHIRYVLNQLDPRSRLGAAAAEAAERRLGGRILGSVTRDEFVTEAVAARRLVGEHAAASRAAHQLAALATSMQRLVSPVGAEA